MKASKVVEEIKRLNLPVFVWGYWTETTVEVTKVLVKYGVAIEGFIQTDTIKEPKVDGRLLSKVELLSCYKEYVLVKGYIEHYYIKPEEYIKDWIGCKAVYEITDLGEVNGIVEEISDFYYTCNLEKLVRIKSELSDELSKRSFDAYFQMKIKGDISSLREIVSKTQYFIEDGPWDYYENDVFLDCGAYDGDTIDSYISKCNTRYSHIIAIEPDHSNVLRLKKRIRDNGWKNITCIEKGVDKENRTLSFASSGTTKSAFSQKGNTEVEVERIDVLCKGVPISIIKMDIEGKEEDALKGGKTIIQENRPILMICAYHKQSDIINIYDIVRDFVGDYKVYFRCHRPLTYEAVYYFVPTERIIRRK